MSVWVGTSGWVYPHWRGVFYPPHLDQADWFSHYARYFATVEINNTFYRLPRAETFDGWRRQAPSGFRYAVKASRFITHLKKLKDPELPLKEFFARARRLDAALGPVLYQLPPHWGVNLERFAHFLGALPGSVRNAVEFRDPTWFTEEVFQLMERQGVAHVLHDMYPLQVPIRLTTGWVYLRFHGDVRHAGDYPRGALRIWAERIQGWLEQGMEVYVYFNNDIGGFALKNAQALLALISEGGRAQ
jgi:uncharacterized protein YecE (DUF72 family)